MFFYITQVFVFASESNSSVWQKYDWDKLTTIVLVGWYDAELMCHAHSHKVRVVNLGKQKENGKQENDKKDKLSKKSICFTDIIFS